MKPICLLFILSLLLSACLPEATPQATQAVTISTATLSPGEQSLEACGFSLNYPSQLKPDGQGYQVLFLAESEPDVSVFISLRRRNDAEASATLETLVENLQNRISPKLSSLEFEPVEVKDIFNANLPGLQGEFTQDGNQTRWMVFVRPNTLLADQLPGDVIYELMAHAPEKAWSQWKPVFDAMFQSIMPRDCGGV